jgi:hypothetical protein
VSTCVCDIYSILTYFAQARKDQPFLTRYQNDWATEEIAKQYLKNKRKNAYKHGWLTVPDNYSHLKQNSDHRSKSGSRTSKAKVMREARESRKASKAGRKAKKSGAVPDTSAGATGEEMHVDDD